MAATKTKQAPFFIGEIFGSAWELLKKNFLVLLGVYLLVIFIPQIMVYVLNGPAERAGLSLVMVVINQLVGILLSMIVTKVLLDVVHERKIDVTFLWKDPARILWFIAASLLFGVMAFLGFIALIIPGIIVVLTFHLFTFLIVDESMKPIEALKESARITKGIRWDLLGFYLVSMVVNVLGVLALVIGLVVTVPLTALAQVVLYKEIRKRVK